MNYPKKINVKSVNTKNGEILKLGIHKDLFKENDVKDEWFNLDILRSKKDNAPYLVINDWKPTQTNDSEEIPF